MEDCKRQRSESSTADDVSHATHIAVSYIDKHYPQYKSVSNSRKREFECDYTGRNNFARTYTRDLGSIIVITRKISPCPTSPRVLSLSRVRE